MAGNRSQELEHLEEGHQRTEIRVHHSTRPALERGSFGGGFASVSRDGRPSAAANYHAAFMQCRSCCNCHTECSYYGTGHFDSRGNYIDP